jgi:hypothetical protein
VIDTPENARTAYHHLSQLSVVGFDMESKLTFKKGEVLYGLYVV